MKADCRDLEKALRGGDPALLAAVEQHAQACLACRRELEEWRQISAAAPALKKSWDSPELWREIHGMLAAESQRPAPPARSPAPWGFGLRWLPAAAIVALFVVATAGLWVFRNSGGREPLANHWQTKEPLLTEQAVDEVEAAEKNYLASIDKLSKLAEPRLAGATSPILVNYKEKLDVLDSAIVELKASIDQNRFNTHLRKELLAVYGEKQRTLQNLMKEVKS
ncbi:MAG TPA: hypothetical protein VGL03_14225 [Thermoanaerobaculia bacterium]